MRDRRCPLEAYSIFSAHSISTTARPSASPKGRPGRTCCSRLGWRWAGVPPRRCWSGLSAISLGYRRRDELSASGAARACAMGGAPVWECGGVDVNTQHEVSIGLEPVCTENLSSGVVVVKSAQDGA
jgi:hypothetical protein